MMKKLLLGIISVLAVSLMFWACSKPENEPSGKVALQAMSLKVPLTCHAPTVVDGRLRFDDNSEFECWEAWLTNVTDSLDTTSYQDDILDSIELALGHQSLRADALAAFEAQNATGWDFSVTPVPVEHWIEGRITRSILNVDREYQIGDLVMRYVSPEYVAYCPANETGILSALRNLPDNPTIEQIIDIDVTAEHLTVSSIKNSERVFAAKPYGHGNGDLGTPVPLAEWEIAGTVSTALTCDNPGYTYFTGFRVSRFLVPQKAKFRFDMNDGFGTYYEYTSSLGSNESIVPEFYANYGPGWHYPTVTVKSISPYNSGSNVVISHTYAVYVHGIDETCSPLSRGAATLHNVDNNNRMLCKIDYYQWFNAFTLSNKTTVSGWTELYQRVGSSNTFTRVKNKDLDLCIRLDTELRASDCTPGVTSTIAKCGKNTYRTEHSATWPGHRSLRSLKGSHHAIWGSLNGFVEQNINVCY
jgi:hypothetical protein